MNPTAPIRVIIVEDQMAIRQDVEDFFRQQPGFIVIGACGTVHEAIVLIQTTKPDLLLLDIGLPDGTGFDILEQLPAQSKIIFLTAHEEIDIRAIRWGAISYLLKPLNEKELTAALQQVISAHPPLPEQIAIVDSCRKDKPPDHIAVRFNNFVRTIDVKEIKYFQGDNGCTTVFLNRGEKILISKNLKDYEEMLSGSSFLRTHQSYLANKIYFDRYHPKERVVYLKDGTEIPVSKGKKGLINQHFKTL